MNIAKNKILPVTSPAIEGVTADITVSSSEHCCNFRDDAQFDVSLGRDLEKQELARALHAYVHERVSLNDTKSDFTSLAKFVFV
ncbi:hypothetical protein HP532_13220 [Pseudomonas sp. CrR25]|nr:hypothetical protein [Pseudomonas sp. CrR25]